ncbi:MAG: hypothetical protein DRO40_05100 [Thermoprotei archaeon]|nr:MAG: hypothetical protein DRO40_05100 [Thermoprotei archaeon]
MGLESLINAVQTIGGVLSGAQGIGTALVLAGIMILLFMGIGFALWFLITLIKQLPKMTFNQFIKFMVFFAVILIITGIILP